MPQKSSADDQFPYDYIYHNDYNNPRMESWPSRASLRVENEEIDLHQLLKALKRRWLTIAGVGVIVFGAVAGWTFRQTPIYQSEFHLLIEPPSAQNKINPLSFEGVEAGKIDYATQIEVLLSPTVLEPIIEKIKKEDPEIEIDYPSLVLGKSLTIKQLNKTTILVISYQGTNKVKVKLVLDHLANAYLDHSLQERQTELNQRINFAVDQSANLKERVDQLQLKLQKFRQKHNLLEPASHSNQLSEQLGKLEAQYFNTQLQLKEAQSLYAILQGEIGLQPEEALAASYLSESPRYQNLLNQLQQVEIQLAQESARFLENSPTIQTLKEQQQNLLPLLRTEAQTVLGNNLIEGVIASPSLASPSSLRLGLNQQFIQTANQIEVLEIRRWALEQGKQLLKEQISQIPSIARQYSELQQELKIATESLIRLLRLQQELQLKIIQQAKPWKVISHAQQPESPFYPKIPLNLAQGTFVGLLLGVGAALLRDRLDSKLQDLAELKEGFSIPLLASVPYDNNQDSKEKEKPFPLLKIVSGQAKKANKSTKKRCYSDNGLEFDEAFRSLNANIRLLGSDNDSKSLVITSSVPSEGKSTISVNLAKAAALMGKRVLLVDADMRLPQVHEQLKLTNNAGLSGFLSDPSLKLGKFIQKPDEYKLETLSVLTAGSKPPDPLRLLSSEGMERLRDSLDKDNNYDLIIYDTPPVLLFAEAKILGLSTRGVIMVASMRKTNRYALRETMNELKMSRVSILGFVANKVSNASKSSYYNNRDYDKYYNGHNKGKVREHQHFWVSSEVR